MDDSKLTSCVVRVERLSPSVLSDLDAEKRARNESSNKENLCEEPLTLAQSCDTKNAKVVVLKSQNAQRTSDELLDEHRPKKSKSATVEETEGQMETAIKTPEKRQQDFDYPLTPVSGTCSQVVPRTIFSMSEQGCGHLAADFQMNVEAESSPSLLSPSTSGTRILKKRLYSADGISAESSDSLCQKSVSFSDEVSILEIPNRHEQCTASSAPSIGDSQPICPSLIGCQMSYDDILCELASPTHVRDLKSVLLATNVKTVGDLSRLSESTICKLPIRSPKVTNAKTSLEAFARRKGYLEVRRCGKAIVADVDSSNNDSQIETAGSSASSQSTSKPVSDISKGIPTSTLGEHHAEQLRAILQDLRGGRVPNESLGRLLSLAGDIIKECGERIS